MKAILTPLRDAISHLKVVRLSNLPLYFDQEERRLTFQSVWIGIVVWIELTGIIRSCDRGTNPQRLAVT